jgi:hypothetical protein
MFKKKYDYTQCQKDYCDYQMKKEEKQALHAITA